MQGYIQYRSSGEPHRLDVDTLNEQLQIKGAARMRTSMKPDEAFGMIFDLEGEDSSRNGILQRTATESPAVRGSTSFSGVQE